jgi:putative phosphoribosyl transferase
MFADRRDAGRQLAGRLEEYKGKKALVLAIPRGGIVVAQEIAKSIGADLDLIISRKIGAPSDPEFAIGAVGPDRSFVVDKKTVAELGISKEYIERTVRIESLEIDRRMLKYRGSRDFPDVRGKAVIVVDDGIATGYTMKVVVDFLRKQKPKKITVAVPVAPRESVAELERDADDVVCLETPRGFTAIGNHYESFPQIGDGEVVNIMGKHGKPRG